MPNLTSRFGYVPYDDIAAVEQNKLRQLFIQIEGELSARRYANLDGLVLPSSEYEILARSFVTNILHIPLDLPENIKAALQQADLLYYAIGKDIRARCIQRMLNPSFLGTYNAPAWIQHKVRKR
jgi:hypothetical protein